MKRKFSFYRGMAAAGIVCMLMLLNLFPVRASEVLSLTGKTPEDGGSLGGTQGEISLTFNQPVEIFEKNGQPQIFFMIDNDGDGKGDDIVEGGEAGGFTNLLAVSGSDPNKVVFNINDRLSPGKNYVLIVNSVIRVKGSTATDPKKSDQVFEGISIPKNMTGWSFNTKTAEAGTDNPVSQQETSSHVQEVGQSETVPQESPTWEEGLIAKIRSASPDSTVEMELNGEAIITAPVLDALKEKENLTLHLLSEEYILALNSGEVNGEYSENFSLNPNINFTSDYTDKMRQLQGGEGACLIFSLDYKGTLPFKLTMTLKNSGDFKDGGKTYLYSYDKDSESLLQEQEFELKTGEISLDLKKGGDYLLMDGPLQEEVLSQKEGRKGGALSLWTAGTVILVAAAAGAGIVYKRKKNFSAK